MRNTLFTLLFFPLFLAVFSKPPSNSIEQSSIVGNFVRDIFSRITSFGTNNQNSNSPQNNYKSQRPESVAAADQALEPQEVIKDIWSTISQYLARQDLNSLESLEDVVLDILNGYTVREKHTVSFYLYNRGLGERSDLIKYGSLDSLRRSTFAKGKPLKILIHGFKMNGFSHFNYLLKNAYMEHGPEYNVINVDWKRLADYVYFNSAFNTRIVGERVGEMLVFLKRNGVIDSYDDVHLVGFSLGAHVAGYTGKYIMKTEHQQIRRITGLDPAGPSFAGLASPNNRLDKRDAKFVDVIHSSSGRSGIEESIGHVDFFPNSGTDQPGCDWERINDYFLRNCSHERAFYLYLETIKGKKFRGCPCSSWEDFQMKKCPCKADTPGAEYMGEICNSTARGDKYLIIKESYPITNPSRN